MSILSNEVFRQFYVGLLETLPMEDPNFTAKLYSAGLLSSYLKEYVGSTRYTRTEKAAYFLDQTIKPSVTSFNKLLNVMEDSEYQHVKDLAKQIKTNISLKPKQMKEESTGNGAVYLHSATTKPTHKPAMNSFPIDAVCRLKSRYLRKQPTAKTDWPKHKVTQFVRLALVEKEDITLRDENLNEVSKLTLQGDVDKILKKKQPIANLRDIFHYQDEPCPRLIVIMGAPGIGKTKLANEICLRWARDGFLSEDFDAVVLIPMRFVQQKSLEQVVIQYIGEEAYQQMKKLAGSRCLIILEGLDEMAADQQKQDHFFTHLISECTVLEESTILITSRPHACDKLNADRQVEVIGFGAEQIKEFIKKSFPNDDYCASKLLQQLNDYHHLKNLCYVPINLIMIIDIFQCSKNKTLPSTFTELYKLFLVMILQRQTMKEDGICSGVHVLPVTTKAISESLKEMLPCIPMHIIGTVYFLCRLSFCGFFDWHVDMKEKDKHTDWKDPKIIFTKDDLIQCGIEVTSQFDGFGLLKATHIHEVPTDTSSYNFCHLSIQEFLSSLYISLLPQQEQLRLMNKYFHDFPSIFIFLCGLTRLKCDDIYQIVHSKMNSYGNPDIIPAIRCLYESNCTAKSAVPFTLNISRNHLVPFDCFCVSHIISNYPVLQLHMLQCQIGDVGAELLAKRYSNNEITEHARLLKVISLVKNDLTAVGMGHVMKIVITTSTTLKEIDVRGNCLGDDGISVITEGLKFNKALTKLKVSHCKFSVKGASCLGNLLKINNSIQELDIADNLIGDSGMISIVNGLQYNNTLTILNVEQCGLSANGVSCLSKLLKVNNSLQELDLRHNDIGDNGMISVADGLQGNSTMTKLNIKRCGISVKGAISISQALMVNQTLLVLHMEGNEIYDNGITAIAGSLSNSRITLLDVRMCGIGFVGVRSLAAALSSNQTIRKLWLQRNPITVDGAYLIMKSAVDNGISNFVLIDSDYEDDKVKRLRIILDDRKRQDIQQ